MIQLETRSPAETLALGEKIGRIAVSGTVIAFRGGLGAGKTTLAKGIARGLGVEDEVTSPTYTLVHEYRGRLPMYHVDAYRLSSGTDFEDIGGLDILAGDGLCVIEWSENVEEILPPHTAVIDIAEGMSPSVRIFKIYGKNLEDSLK